MEQKERPVLISVIVPIYNTLNYLQRCVDSIRSQTYKYLEIILVDDGSTDRSGALAEKFALEDRRVRVFHKENGGVSSARNLGIEKARGEFIGFVDSDDYIEPDMYERMAAAMLMKKAPIVQISRDELDESGTRLADVCIPPAGEVFCTAQDFIRDLLLHKGDCSFCTKLVKCSLFDDHRFPEGVLNEDFSLLIEMLQEIDGILILPKQCYHVVCRKQSTTRSRTKDSFSRVFLDIVDNADRMQELVDRKYPGLHSYAIRFNLYQRLDYLLHVPISQMTKDNAFYRRVKKYLRRHLSDSVINPYLTGKNKIYLLLLTIAPKTVRKVHARKMKASRQTEGIAVNDMNGR